MTNKLSNSQGGGSPPAVRPGVKYEVGGHVVCVTQVSIGRWVVALDENKVDGSYDTRADAWEAGVREADRRDRQQPMT